MESHTYVYAAGREPKTCSLDPILIQSARVTTTQDSRLSSAEDSVLRESTLCSRPRLRLKEKFLGEEEKHLQSGGMVHVVTLITAEGELIIHTNIIKYHD